MFVLEQCVSSHDRASGTGGARGVIPPIFSLKGQKLNLELILLHGFSSILPPFILAPYSGPEQQ